MLETEFRLLGGLLDLLRDPVWQGIAGVITLIGLVIALYPKIRSRVRGHSDTTRHEPRARSDPTSVPSNLAQHSPNTSAPPANQWFDGHVYEDLSEAREEAARRDMPLFVVIYDGKHPRKSKLDYSLGYFLEYQTTKNLVRENFVQVLVNAKSEGIADLVPPDDPLENSRLVVMKPDGEILRSEGVYANPDEGLKRVREDIRSVQGGAP